MHPYWVLILIAHAWAITALIFSLQKVHDESHIVLELEICELFVVLESANQPVVHTTSNESRLHRTPAQEVSGHMYVRVHVPICLNVYSKLNSNYNRESYARKAIAHLRQSFCCGEDVLACERIDRIDARCLRRRANSGRTC